MGNQRFARAVCAVLCALFLFTMSAPNALAGTTGVLSGTVTDKATHLGLADVVVTAASPSGSYKGTTNARGFFSMTGIFADTYTVSFTRSGYEPVNIPGVTVSADQVALANTSLSKSLRTIATVVSRSQSSAYQPNQTTDTITVGSAGIANLQGSTFNFSESNLLTSLPGSTLDSSGYPVIHGGREYEEGFQFEGIPYTDAYSNQFNNALSVPLAGVSSVQLTPGAGDASQAGGGTGTFNLVAKRGTYPSYADIGVAIGTGIGFDHRLTSDYSFATPDGRISNFASFAGDNRAFKYGDGSLPASQMGRFYSRRADSDREFLDNLVYRFGRNKSQSIQGFVDIASHIFYQGYGGFGSGQANSSNLCFASCDPRYDSVWASIFGMRQGQVQAISALYPGQTQPVQYLSSTARAPFTYFEPNQSFKLEYTNNINPSTFFSARLYRTNSVTTFDGPSTTGSYVGDVYLLQGGQTTGGTLSLQKQVNDNNLLDMGVDFGHLHPIDSYLSDSYGFYGAYLGALNGYDDQYGLPYAFISPNDPQCPLGPGGCGYAYGAFPSATQLKYPQFDQVSTVNRQDYSAFISDKVNFGDRLKAELGVRMDAATYRLPQPGIDPYYCTSLYQPVTYTAPTTFDAAHNWQCNAKATFSFDSNAVTPKILQPRVGVTYRLGSSSSVRFTYNRAVQFVPIASIDFGEVDPGAYINPYHSLPAWNAFGETNADGSVKTNCGLPGFIVQCRNFGEQLYWAAQNFDGIPYQPARPTTSNNYQVTLEHQFNSGLLNGVAFSVSPWYRKQFDTIASESAPILGSNGLPILQNGSFVTGPPLLTNAGKEFASGVDLNITRERAYGLSGQFTASYINEFSSVIPLSGLEDFYPSIVPASILAGNVYRVGFVSPFQATLGLSYKTHTGWRVNPRYSYNIGYPSGLGNLTAAVINGTALNVPNTNAVVGSAPAGPTFFIDPNNPGSVFTPNIVASRGAKESASPGGTLSPPDANLDLTVEYSPPSSKMTFGMNVNNVFNQIYTGSTFNARYQPIATGISGPLTGYSTSSTNYTAYPSAWPLYGTAMRGKQVYVDSPNGFGRSFYFYIQARL